LLVRNGKGGKPRRQPLAQTLADELHELAIRRTPAADAPVFTGLAGGRLQPTVLANIIRRAAARGYRETLYRAYAPAHRGDVATPSNRRRPIGR
jgi:integrase